MHFFYHIPGGFLCWTCGLIIVANALRKKKHVSHFVSVGSLCLLILCSGTFVGERMVGLKVELLPIAYTVCAGGILLMLNRGVTYDVSTDFLLQLKNGFWKVIRRISSILSVRAENSRGPLLCS